MKDFFRKNKNRNRDDRGVTLLELILAISIFSIAAIVLFQGFVTSGRINKKSNLYLEATTTAQNVMEELKSKTFADVSAAFNYPLDRTTNRSRFAFLESKKSLINANGANSLTIKEVIKEDDSYNDVRLYREEDGDNTDDVTASVISKDNGATYEFNPRETGENASKYYFEMTNVKDLHETFDVLVEFDGSEDSGYKKDSFLADNEKNDFEMPNIAKLDTKTNAFLVMGKNWDENAMRSMVAEQLVAARNEWDSWPKERWEELNIERPEDEVLLDQDDVYAHIKRTLQVTLEESGGIVTAKARYVLDASGYTKEGGNELETMSLCAGDSTKGGEHTGENGCFCKYSSAFTSFYSSEADTDLKGVYIFYYPNYNSTSTSSPLDYIEFENTINYPVNLYVIKQREEKSGQPLTSAQEISYRMNLKVTESPEEETPNWNTSPSIFKAKTILRTNLDYDISEVDEIESRSKITQMSLTYSDTASVVKTVSGNYAKTILQVNGLDDRKVKDRIYTAKVSVYKAGAAAKNFPEEDLVATLDGAKED